MRSLQIDERFIIFALLMIVLMLILTVFMIVKIRKWSREGTLAEPIPNPQD